MWMGGSVPLGYDVRDRKLVVNETEAAKVRRVFEGFAAIGSATKLAKVLRDEGVTTKRGRPIDKGDIYKLLNARVYRGEVVHKGERLSRRAPRHRLARAVGRGAHHPDRKARGLAQTGTGHKARRCCAG